MSTLADRFVATEIRRIECLQLKQWRYDDNAAKFNFQTKRIEEVKIRSSLLFTSVIHQNGNPDRHHNDADPDFHSDADSDLGLNDADPHADPTPCFTHVRKSDCNVNFHSLQYQFTMFKILYHQCHKCHNFKYFGQRIEFFWNKVGQNDAESTPIKMGIILFL